MGTRNHPFVSNQPFFVAAVTKNRRPLFRDGQATQMMLSMLERLRNEMPFALLAYVVMPDHIHLLIVPSPAASLSRIMQSIKGRFARLWNRRACRDGNLWQPRYYESAVRTQEQLIRWLEYIDRNPVEAGLAASPSEYPYCTAGGGLSTDLSAYLDGTWAGQAEARPSHDKTVMAGRAEARPSER